LRRTLLPESVLIAERDRMPDTPTPNEQGASPIAIAVNGSLVIGGQAVPTRWQIESLAGLLSYSNTPPPPSVPEIGSIPTSLIRLFGAGAPSGSLRVIHAGVCAQDDVAPRRQNHRKGAERINRWAAVYRPRRRGHTIGPAAMINLSELRRGSADDAEFIIGAAKGRPRWLIRPTLLLAQARDVVQ
jgi:hypothetical protein